MNDWYLQHKREVLSHYSPELKCIRCGCDDIRCLTIDHVNGGGNKHRKLNGNTLDWLKKNNYPKGFQVLCANCNFKKERVKNYKIELLRFEKEYKPIKLENGNKVCNRCKRQLSKKKMFGKINKHDKNTKYRGICKLCANDRIRNYRFKVRFKVISHYSPDLKCKRCGIDDYDVLTLDHVNGNGHIHRSNVSRKNIYKDIINNNFPEGEYQILCMNCQLIKSDENGEHKRKHNHL